ncbi:MAG: sugar phosphate isomerase/epimerase [Candidatus Gastranaerophilales bacterium]|nr:sugar phosphate isomerase/epimerase [Candidatus Gastranaerophilales bacterium]
MNIYISSTMNKDFNEVVKYAAQNNVSIEISRFGSLKTLDREYEDRKEFYKKALKNFPGKVTLHGFFYDIAPSANEIEVLSLTKKRYQQSFEIARATKAHTIVFHPCYNPLIKHYDYEREYFKNQIEFYKNYIKDLESENITAVLENTFEYAPESTLQIIEGVNSKNLKACLDLGHANINSPMPVNDWVEQLGDKLVHVHMHNNYGDADNHLSVLNGTIDIKGFLDKLKEKNLNPNIVLEIFTQQEIDESLDYLKKYEEINV